MKESGNESVAINFRPSVQVFSRDFVTEEDEICHEEFFNTNR